MNKSLAVVAAIILVIGISGGILLLTRNKKDNNAVDNNQNITNNTTVTPPPVTTPPNGIAAFNYKDGTYESDGSYTSPAGTETVKVSLTVERDIVTAVTVTSKAKDSQSKVYQSLFIKGISGEVVGEKLDGLTVGKVNGSSLTGGGFNKAIQAIQVLAEN